MCIFRTTCDESQASQYQYLDASCIQRLLLSSPDYQLFYDQCIVFDTAFFVIDINTVLDRCIIDGIAVSTPSFCDTDPNDDTSI